MFSDRTWSFINSAVCIIIRNFCTKLYLFSALIVLICTSAISKNFPESFSDLVQELSPAVVNITTTAVIPQRNQLNPTVPPGSPFEEFFRDFMERQQPGGQQPQRQRRGTALGSGFLISKDGLLVTNNHVIENADEIEIEMLDGRVFEAKVLGSDPKTDIALLKIQVDGPFPFVEFGNSDTARVGDWVLAIGNPLGQGFSVSAGIISARGRDLRGPYDDFIQTDAAINRGNSGGPLFDMNGEVIGVNTAILSPNGGSIGIGFSMSSSVVEKVISQLREFGETRRGWLGVRIQNLNPEVAEALGLVETEGALITDVPDGPSRDAGIRSGDVILQFDNKKVSNSGELVKIVGDSPVGKKVAVELWRDGTKKRLFVVLGRLEDIQAAAPNQSQGGIEKIVAGMTISGLTAENREKYDVSSDIQGVIITSVALGSTAEKRGLVVGDIIVKVGQKSVLTPNEILDTFSESLESGANSILLLVKRNGSGRFVAIPLGE
jgi:serine protease Do